MDGSKKNFPLRPKVRIVANFETTLGIRSKRPLEVRSIAAIPVSEVPEELLTPLVSGSDEDSSGRVEHLLKEVATHKPKHSELKPRQRSQL